MAVPVDSTGLYHWPAGERFAAELPSLVALAGKRVLDLGCGQGRLGTLAMVHGAAAVVFADADAQALAAVRGVHAHDPRARFTLHQWGEALDDPDAGTFDVVLGGDILYRSAYFAALLTTIAQQLSSHGQAMLSDPRRTLDAELPMLAAAARLSWISERRETYTLVRIERSMA